MSQLTDLLTVVKNNEKRMEELKADIEAAKRVNTIISMLNQLLELDEEQFNKVQWNKNKEAQEVNKFIISSSTHLIDKLVQENIQLVDDIKFLTGSSEYKVSDFDRLKLTKQL